MRRRLHEEEHAGELNIVPYLDIVTNLVMFMLLSMTGLISLGVVNVSAPKIGGDAGQQPGGEEKPRLLLTVAIGRQGFYVAGANAVLGGPPDAQNVDTRQPPTIPRKDGKYDFAALTETMGRIKDRFPNETNLILSADEDVPYEILIRTMDACREAKVGKPDGTTDRRLLFFDVSLSLVS